MVSMTFSDDQVIIRFSQGDQALRRASAQQYIHSEAAERQCRSHIASHPSNDFSLRFDGWFPAPAVEVAMKRSLLQKLPLLKDVQRSTPGGESMHAPANLPCTVWGLVSLLILLGGGVGVEEWFRGDPALQDPSLPANTLLSQPSDLNRRIESLLLAPSEGHVVAAVQAASFMGCTDTVSQLTKWLQYCVRALAESHTPFSSSSSHRLKVLQCVAPEHERAVFSGSKSDSATAVKLPASLLTKWIASSAGDIDLLKVNPSSEQWVKLAVAICQAPPGAVECLHVRLPKAENELMVAMTALLSIVAHMSHLQCLDLHGWPPGVKQLPVLHQLLSQCPGSLYQLLLDTTCQSLGLHEKTSFFAAVAQVPTLRELHMPKWVGFISDASHLEACDPLRRIPGLRIFVPKFHLENLSFGNHFPPDLEFHGS